MPKDMQVYLAVLVVLLPAIFWFGRWLIRSAPPVTSAARTVTLHELFGPPVATEPVNVVEPVALVELVMVPSVEAEPVKGAPCPLPDLILVAKAQHEITWVNFAAEVGVAPSTLRGWVSGRTPSDANRDRLMQAVDRLCRREGDLCGTDAGHTVLCCERQTVHEDLDGVVVHGVKY